MKLPYLERWIEGRQEAAKRYDHLVEEHHLRTASARAAELLADWEQAVTAFRQIVPVAALAPAPEPEPQAADTPTELRAPKT